MYPGHMKLHDLGSLGPSLRQQDQPIWGPSHSRGSVTTILQRTGNSSRSSRFSRFLYRWLGLFESLDGKQLVLTCYCGMLQKEPHRFQLSCAVIQSRKTVAPSSSCVCCAQSSSGQLSGRTSYYMLQVGFRCLRSNRYTVGLSLLFVGAACIFSSRSGNCITIPTQSCMIGKEVVVRKHTCLLSDLAYRDCLLGYPSSSVGQPSVFSLTEKTKLTTISTRIKTALTIVQRGEITNTTHSAGDSTIVTRSVVVHFSDQYDNRL